MHPTAPGPPPEHAPAALQVELTVANSIWAKSDVLDSFKSVCETNFEAQTHSLDGAGPINSWVDKATKGMIKKLVDQEPPGPAVLLNAVYFKGQWMHKFDAAKTVRCIASFLQSNPRVRIGVSQPLNRTLPGGGRVPRL